MADSYSELGINDTKRQELLTHLKKLGLTTDNELSRMSSESPEENQKFVDGLLETKKRLQDACRQLITIKEVIEKYLNQLISDMLEGKAVIEPLQRAMEIYPSLQFLRWLVEDEEIDLAEFVKDSDLNSNYTLPILYRWKYEYKPLGEVWWELRRREEGRENHWTGIEFARYYNELRHMPQLSIQLLSRSKIVWNAREDVDDVVDLARGLLTICLRALGEPRERGYVYPDFIERMNKMISETEEVINRMKASPILSSQKVVPEGSPEVQ